MRLKELENWLSPAGAGEVIGVTKQAVTKYLEDGTLRGVKTVQGWLVDPKDTERVARERAQKKASKQG
jgi:hypothetical protein